MMAIAFREFPTIGVVAIFEEASGGGVWKDPSAPRNEPAVDPEGNLDKVKFSTLLDNLEVYSDDIVTISHTSGGTTGGSDGQNQVSWNQGAAEWTLKTHSLGYVPLVLIAQSTKAIYPGLPVQQGTGGAARYVYPYVDTTTVKLHEVRSSSGSALSALSIDYRVIVFLAPRDASGSKLWDFDPSTGILKLGFDRFSSDRSYLQVVAGGSPFGVFGGRTADLNNGAPRFALPDGTHYDPIPSNMQARIDTRTGYGSSMAYGGSFAPTDVFQVQAP
ncbi:MAG: hypothetical protein ABI216_00610 [Devosia sp.]